MTGQSAVTKKAPAYKKSKRKFKKRALIGDFSDKEAGSEEVQEQRDFIDADLQKQNVPSLDYSGKIFITKNDVNLTPMISREAMGFYQMHYIVQINLKPHQADPGFSLRASQIDLVSLRTAILSNIKPYDLRYVILHSFDTRGAIFRFNHDAWLRDATSRMRVTTHFSRFDRSFKFNLKLPRMIMTDFTLATFEPFLQRRFIDWLESSRKEAQYFRALIPDNVRRNIRTKLRNMFEWSYDSQWNEVVARLKNIYILALLYATGTMVEKLRASNNISRNQRQLFAKDVEKNIPKFDRKKWEDYVKKRFM